MRPETSSPPSPLYLSFLVCKVMKREELFSTVLYNVRFYPNAHKASHLCLFTSPSYQYLLCWQCHKGKFFKHINFSQIQLSCKSTFRKNVTLLRIKHILKFLI